MELVADLRIDKNARSGAAQIDAHEYRWGRTPLGPRRVKSRSTMSYGGPTRRNDLTYSVPVPEVWISPPAVADVK